MVDANTPILVEILRISAITFLYSVSILGWGDLARRFFPASDDSFIDYLSTRLVLGCFSLYAALILLSAGKVLNRTSVTAALAVGLLFALSRLRSAAEKLRQAFRQTSEWSYSQRLLLGIICILAALQVACGFTPLVFYDSQIYQLATPVQFLNAGGFVHVPWNVYSNSPMALQLTLGMSWIFDSTGSTFKLLMTLLGCWILLGAARIASQLGVWASLLAALFVVSYPEFWVWQTLGTVDLPVASLLLFGVIWWQQALRRQSWTLLSLAGMAFGLVLASRYQGIVLIAWSLLAVFVAESFRIPALLFRNLLKATAIVVVIVLIIAPWIVRNYAYFGNPVFPLLYGWLGGSEWSVDQANRLRNEVMGRSLFEASATEMALAPVNALMTPPGNGLFGPILLLGSLLAICAGIGEFRLYGVLGLGGLIIWGLIHPTVTMPLLRFTAPNIILLLTCTGAILASNGFVELKSIYIAIALALASVIISFVLVESFIPVWKSLTSSPGRASVWRANVPAWEAMQFANANLDPAHHKVLFIGETRGLWLNIPSIAPSAFNGPQLAEIFTGLEPDTWRDRLKKLGVTHLLVNSQEWGRLREGWAYFVLPNDSVDKFNRWLQSLPVLFNDQHGTVVLLLQ